MTANGLDSSGLHPASGPNTALGCPRDYLDNRFVYLVISPRTRGLSIGVNITPEVRCSYFCIYCEVPRTPRPGPPLELDVQAMGTELRKTMDLVRSGKIRQSPTFRDLDPVLLELREVLISGDGEPTLSPKFHDAILQIIQLRATGAFPFFKVSLFTNGSYLDGPGVLDTLKLLTSHDEIWVKLDAGTQAYMNMVNGPDARLDKVLSNILLLGKTRAVGIQSLFPKINGAEPPPAEITAYVEHLKELKAQGANIEMVQVFSAGKTARKTGCEYLSLKSLQRICQRIKMVAGIRAEVF